MLAAITSGAPVLGILNQLVGSPVQFRNITTFPPEPYPTALNMGVTYTCADKRDPPLKAALLCVQTAPIHPTHLLHSSMSSTKQQTLWLPWEYLTMSRHHKRKASPKLPGSKPDESLPSLLRFSMQKDASSSFRSSSSVRHTLCSCLPRRSSGLCHIPYSLKTNISFETHPPKSTSPTCPICQTRAVSCSERAT